MIRDVLALLTAGLGIFCVGLHLVSSGLQDSTSRTLRSLIRRSTRGLPACAAVGVLTGAVLQSTSAVATILGSVATSGMISLRQALPIVAFANVGTTALVFAGALDIRIAVMFAVGIAGIAFSLASEFKWRAALSVVLGVALVLYGSNLVTEASTDVGQANWFSGVLQSLYGSATMAFGVGTAASFLMQSTTAGALMSVALANAGQLGLTEAIAMLYGANLGSTLMRIVLTHRSRGILRQISHFQDLFKVTGVAVFGALFGLERFFSVPLVAALATRLVDDVPLQLAGINLLFNGVMALLAAIFEHPVESFVKRTWPSSGVESLSVPRYLSHDAVGDPETAIDLLEKEQMRILKRVREYLPVAEPQGPGTIRVDPTTLHRAFLVLFGEIEHFHAELVSRHMDRETSERLGNVHGREKLLELIEDSLHHLSTSVHAAPTTSALDTLISDFVQALDFLLMFAGDAARTLDQGRAEFLFDLSSDRGEMMGTIRSLHLAPDRALTADEKTLLLRLTNLFERTVWMLQRYAELLVRNVAFTGGASVPAPADRA